MQASQDWEEVLVVLVKGGKKRFILTQAQMGAYHFHREYLSIRKLGQGPTLAQPLAVCDRRHHLVNPAKTGANELVQVPECPPRAVLC